MKLLGKLTLLLGGLLTMTTLQACGPADPSVGNRTIEQYNMEQEMAPLLEVLNSKKIDSDKHSLVKDSLTVWRNSGTEQETYSGYSVTLDSFNNSYAGVLTQKQGGEEFNHNVIYKDREIQGDDSLPEDLRTLSLVFDEWKLDKDYFNSMEIVKVSDSIETYLKTLSYEETKNSAHSKAMIEQYKLSDDAKISVTLMKTKKSKTVYRYAFQYSIWDRVNNIEIWRTFVINTED